MLGFSRCGFQIATSYLGCFSKDIVVYQNILKIIEKQPA